jgi:hypothetical protein
VKYYVLRCVTCDETFPPLVATDPDELLCPEYDEITPMLAERLSDFHNRHAGHQLRAVDNVDGDPLNMRLIGTTPGDRAAKGE